MRYIPQAKSRFDAPKRSHSMDELEEVDEADPNTPQPRNQSSRRALTPPGRSKVSTLLSGSSDSDKVGSKTFKTSPSPSNQEPARDVPMVTKTYKYVPKAMSTPQTPSNFYPPKKIGAISARESPAVSKFGSEGGSPPSLPRRTEESAVSSTHGPDKGAFSNSTGRNTTNRSPKSDDNNQISNNHKFKTQVALTSPVSLKNGMQPAVDGITLRPSCQKASYPAPSQESMKSSDESYLSENSDNLRGGVDDDDSDYRLFPERTSIQYTPEFDTVAVEAYRFVAELKGRQEEDRSQRPPGISGYGFDQIFVEEQEPPLDPSAGGIFGDYLAKRRRQITFIG